MPGPFTYLNNIPQATDQLSVSQGQLLTNFASIKSLVDVNLVDFSSPNAGKHNFSQYVSQAADPALGATEIAVYNRLSGVTGAQELFVLKGVGTPYSITAQQGGGSGWFSTNGAIIMAWGEATVTGQSTINFARAFTAVCYQVVACIQNPSGGDANKNVSVVSYTNAGVTVYVSPRITTGPATALVSYFAVGA